jgi:hypothetical protein
MHCDDLLDLPRQMHWHAFLSLINIGLSQNEIKIRLLLQKIAQGISQILDIVKGDSNDVLTQNHGFESELTSTVIRDQAKLATPRLGPCMNGYPVHSWQQIWTKRHSIASKLYFLGNLVLEEGCLVCSLRSVLEIVPCEWQFSIIFLSEPQRFCNRSVSPWKCFFPQKMSPSKTALWYPHPQQGSPPQPYFAQIHALSDGHVSQPWKHPLIWTNMFSSHRCHLAQRYTRVKSIQLILVKHRTDMEASHRHGSISLSKVSFSTKVCQSQSN